MKTPWGTSTVYNLQTTSPAGRQHVRPVHAGNDAVSPLQGGSLSIPEGASGEIPGLAGREQGED